MYGYYRAAPAPAPAPVARRGDCGVYHYWNGQRCADARVTPPDLN